MSENIEKEEIDYCNLNKCKNILETNEIFKIDKEDAKYLKIYLIPLIDNELKKEEMDYYNLNKCKNILETNEIFKINKEKAKYLKKYITPLIDNELKKEKYDKAKLIHILLNIKKQ